MKKINLLYLLFFLHYINDFCIQNVYAQSERFTQLPYDLPPELLKLKKNKHKKFSFNVTEKPLVEIINDMAAALGINIIVPQGGLAIPPTLKVTINQSNPLPLTEAWKEFIIILELAGYVIFNNDNFFEIKKLDATINRQPLDIYIDSPLDQIPDTQEVIRAIFYLQNLSIKSSWNDLSAMIKDMLSPTADIRSDAKTNAIILTDKASNIKGLMRIITELDKTGTRDMIEVLPLYYVSAQLVDDLFNKQLLAGRQPTMPGVPTTASDESNYFPKHTRVVALDRKNSIVIMGTADSIDLVRDFIIKYIDRPPESGASILHIYDLQYLNAQEFAPILQTYVNPAQTDQSAGKVATGPKQYFKNVIVQAELTRKSKEIAPTITQGQAVGAAQPITEGAQIGGNRLIVAATKDDWIRIKKIIEDLDKPQLQVALEVLIVDISLSANKLLGNQMRNKQGFNESISKNVNFQTANISEPVLKPGVDTGIADSGGLGVVERPPDALMANLLQLGAPFDNNENIASTRDPGSLIIALKDSANNGVWSVWQILNQYSAGTILAQPFIVTKNHKQATVSIAQQRFLQGSADTSNIAPKISFEWVTAALTVDILPHISSTNNVNLQVTINVNEFLNQQSNSRITRLVQTNANVGSGQILALGGLTRLRENISKNVTPLLGYIPIIGWWFKQKEQVKEKNNLLIFICPTILTPRALGGIDQYTGKKLEYAKDSLDEQLLMQNMHDPINRWFFKPDVCLGERTINDFSEQSLSARYETGPSENVAPTITPVTPLETIKEGEVHIAEPINPALAENLKDLLKDEQNPLIVKNELVKK